MPKKSPAQTRMSLAARRRTALGSALHQLQFDLASPDSRAAFLEWRNNPLTLLMLDCVRELELTPPAGYLDTDDVGVQYGVSSGLSLAHSFLSDPSTMYPQLFSGVTPDAPRELPEADFKVEPYAPAARKPSKQ